jgi:hypothetical protein
VVQVFVRTFFASCLFFKILAFVYGFCFFGVAEWLRCFLLGWRSRKLLDIGTLFDLMLGGQCLVQHIGKESPFFFQTFLLFAFLLCLIPITVLYAFLMFLFRKEYRLRKANCWRCGKMVFRWYSKVLLWHILFGILSAKKHITTLWAC